MRKNIICYTMCIITGIAGALNAAPAAFAEHVRKNTGGESAETARVRISSSIKTHSSRYHIFEKKNRGTGAYRMEVEAGGKTYQFTAAPVKEVTEKGDRKNPEEGSGARFTFSGDFSIPAGKHKVTFRLPEDNVSVTSEVTFVAGDNTITVTPVYAKITRNRIIGFRGDRHFTQHVKSLQVAVNGSTAELR